MFPEENNNLNDAFLPDEDEEVVPGDEEELASEIAAPFTEITKQNDENLFEENAEDGFEDEEDEDEDGIGFDSFDDQDLV